VLIRTASSSTYQWNNDFAIGVSLEMIWLLKRLADDSVVIDLAVDSQCDALICVGEGLCSALCDV